jgi:hypothetical protein
VGNLARIYEKENMTFIVNELTEEEKKEYL